MRKKRNLPPWQGRFLLVSGPKLEPRPKTLEVADWIRRSSRPGATWPASPTVGRSYFFDLVVDFLLPPEDFLPAELRELDLLLLFFAMALVPPFLSDKFTGPQKSRQ